MRTATETASRYTIIIEALADAGHEMGTDKGADGAVFLTRAAVYAVDSPAPWTHLP
jgi:hypothetical protein